METPEWCFLDIVKNGAELLAECGFSLPDWRAAPAPALIFLYHPALGPLYSVIKQKLRAGALAPGSEWQLHIADLDVENLSLRGSLLIHAEAVMGHRSRDGLLHYSDKTGKCTLHNVTVRNRGIAWGEKNVFWKNQIHRQEACEILILGNGEFFAENVTFNGGMKIVVEEGVRLTAVQDGDEIKLIREKIKGFSWSWAYSVDSDKRIAIKKQ